MELFRAALVRPVAVMLLAVGSLVIPVLSSPPVGANPISPSGTHDILVIPVQFPAHEGPVSLGDAVFCPNTSLPCPTPLHFAKPSKSGAALQTLLDTQASPYFSSESYGQVNVHYTVLTDPDTLDSTDPLVGKGWWPSPVSNQCFNGNAYFGASPCLNVLAHSMTNIVTNYVVQTLCNNPLEAAILHCGTGPTDFPRRYEGVAILNNWATQGTSPGNSYQTVPMSSTSWVTSNKGFNAPPYMPTWQWSPGVMSLAIEGSPVAKDFVPQTILHETGHFLGTLTHYGDCSKWLPVGSSDTPDTCLRGWSIMGDNYNTPIPELTGYEKLAFGWLAPGNQAGWTPPVYHNLLFEPSFVDSKTILPIEIPPVHGANLIRLDRGSDQHGGQWTRASGALLNEYDVECRAPESTNPFVQPPNASPVSTNGLLISNVHEYSMTFGDKDPHRAPASGLVPSVNTTMVPGQTWSDSTAGVTVTFNGWTFLQDAGHWGCQVTVSKGEVPGLSLPFFRVIQRSSAGTDQSSDTVGLAPDIGINGVAGSSSPLWPKHPNLVVAQVNSANDVTPSGQVNVVASDAMTDTCGGTPAATATGTLTGFGSTATASVSIPAGSKQTSLSTQVALATNVGSPTADRPTLTGQMVATAYAAPSAKSTVTFSVALAASCPQASSFYIDPPQGSSWGIKVTPRIVTLQPGSSAQIKVTLTAPSAGATGAPPSQDLPILVRNEVFLDDALPTGSPSAPCAPAELYVCYDAHDWPLGTMHVLARTRIATAHAALTCPTTATVGGSASLGVTSDQTDGTAMLEVDDGSGERPVMGSASSTPGLWSANVALDHVGKWKVIARWNGNSTHAPAQTKSCTIKVVH